MREIILGHVEFALIFLFDGFLCKIAILEPLKVRFLDKKQKLLSDDGSLEENSDKFNFLITQVAEIDGKRPKKPVLNEGETNVNNNKLELR